MLDAADPGLHVKSTYELNENISPLLLLTRPKIAILREQGVNGQVEMAAAFDRAGFAAVDVHMSDIISGRVSAGRFQGHRGVRRILLRRRAGRGRGLGEIHPVQSAGARRVRSVLPAQGHLRAGRVQRLPDDEQPARDHSGRGKLGALRAQPVGAIRGALRDGRSAAIAVDLLQRHGGQPHAHRGGARRRLCRFRRRQDDSRRRRNWSRCAMSTIAAMRPRPIRSTPTDRRRASPA